MFEPQWRLIVKGLPFQGLWYNTRHQYLQVYIDFLQDIYQVIHEFYSDGVYLYLGGENLWEEKIRNKINNVQKVNTNHKNLQNEM